MIFLYFILFMFSHIPIKIILCFILFFSFPEIFFDSFIILKFPNDATHYLILVDRILILLYLICINLFIFFCNELIIIFSLFFFFLSFHLYLFLCVYDISFEPFTLSLNTNTNSFFDIFTWSCNQSLHNKFILFKSVFEEYHPDFKSLSEDMLFDLFMDNLTLFYNINSETILRVFIILKYFSEDPFFFYNTILHSKAFFVTCFVILFGFKFFQ